MAVVDIGTNSTRLLIGEVDRPTGRVEELVRRSTVTRLGDGVDATGSLSEEAAERVFATLAEYRLEMDGHGCTANLAVLTSAVREADNGRAFAERVHLDYGLDARVLTGEEEAQLTFRGAMSGRSAPQEPTVVIDIGGGSTEFVIGLGREIGFHTSLQAGVVRMSERHIRSDPPTGAELEALAEDVRRTFLGGLPEDVRRPVRHGIAVAGTATSAAAIDLELDPYDPGRVHGYTLQLETVQELLAGLAVMPEEDRRRVTGLAPGRAPTIIAGMVLLEEAVRAFALEAVEVSEHDILFGGILLLGERS